MTTTRMTTTRRITVSVVVAIVVSALYVVIVKLNGGSFRTASFLAIFIAIGVFVLTFIVTLALPRKSTAALQSIDRYRSSTNFYAPAAYTQLPFQPLAPLTQAANATGTRIFVSHSHKDDAITMRLVGDLRKAGAAVWVDIANLQSGDFMTRINTALSATDWVVLVQSPHSLTSSAVQAEINAALTMTWNHRIRDVIPFIIAPYNPADVPPTWSTLHYYDATKNYYGALQQLLRAVGLRP